MVHMPSDGPIDRRPQERFEYRLYFALIYPFSLLAAMIGAFRPARTGARLSVFERAVEDTRRVVPWVFMGR
ncbi:MAG: hypothetical protein AAF224_04405 [Pseudomonadota bacterium]